MQRTELTKFSSNSDFSGGIVLFCFVVPMAGVYLQLPTTSTTTTTTET